MSTTACRPAGAGNKTRLPMEAFYILRELDDHQAGRDYVNIPVGRKMKADQIRKLFKCPYENIAI